MGQDLSGPPSFASLDGLVKRVAIARCRRQNQLLDISQIADHLLLIMYCVSTISFQARAASSLARLFFHAHPG